MRELDQASDPLELEIPTSILFGERFTAHDVRVYAAVLWFDRAGIDRPSQSAVAELAQIHRNSVVGSLTRLAGAGKLSVDTSAAPHQYQVRNPVHWKGA